MAAHVMFAAAGSRRFGMCFVDDKGRVAGIGTTLEVKDFVMEPSGRMYVTNKGIERFRVTNVVKKTPVLVCDVEVLPEDDDQSDEVRRGCVCVFVDGDIRQRHRSCGM
eukprot:GHRQ01027220.1.p3 GENE.GHRQ01027220.1~~GHRQ01027220.1.p3  ORF type:complete len:108 (+),score=18.72 GHRQ01027220.1:98-421(+)